MSMNIPPWEQQKQKAPLERLSGTGTVTTRRGKTIIVAYQLSVPKGVAASQNWPPGSGLRDVSGRVWCPYDGSFVSVNQGKIMTLRIEDGRRLRFLHQDRDGLIVIKRLLV
jgi:hypothetical protein